VTAESFNALATAHIPELACAIDAPCETVIPSEVKLATREFTCMTFEGKDALASTDIPYFSSVVERSSQ
jgi:hypothetical protein